MPPKTTDMPDEQKQQQLLQTGVEANVAKSPQPTYEPTIYVACKKPGGHILQLCKRITVRVPVLGAPGAARDEEQWRPTGEQVRLHSPVLPFGVVPPWRVVAGYAITEGVKKDFFDEWLAQHADDPIVTNQLLLWDADQSRLASMCKVHAMIRTGLEPLDVSSDEKGRMKDLRVPRRNAEHGLMVETARTDREDA